MHALADPGLNYRIDVGGAVRASSTPRPAPLMATSFGKRKLVIRRRTRA